MPSLMQEGMHTFSCDHIAYSNNLFAKILYLSCLFDARVGVLLSALYATHILMNFLYPIFSFFIEWPLTQLFYVTNHAVSVGLWILLPDMYFLSPCDHSNC